MINLLTDPPRPGYCKLRVKSDGTRQGTHVIAIDHAGAELEVDGVTAIGWKLPSFNDAATADITVIAPEVELDAPVATVRPVGA